MHRKRDWLELPSDVLVDILCRIGVVDVLESAQKVCTTWHKICKGPAMWRVIHMDVFYNGPIPNRVHSQKTYKEMCKHAVDRSQGQLVDITIVGFVDDELLLYVADRASQLKRLEIAFSFADMNESWTKALTKFPLLEELGLYATMISKEAIEIAGRSCPMLKTLKLNQERTRSVLPLSEYDHEVNIQNGYMKAMVIGENFPDLTHLELIGSTITNNGLTEILDGCLNLESLDLRQCSYIDLNGDIGKRCSKQITHLKLPYDYFKDYPYVYIEELVMSDHDEAFFNIDVDSDFEDSSDDSDLHLL